VEALLEAGITQTGPHELSVLVPAFSRQSGGAVDLVIVDQFRKASSTVARLPVPPVRCLLLRERPDPVSDPGLIPGSGGPPGSLAAGLNPAC